VGNLTHVARSLRNDALDHIMADPEGNEFGVV
jgi:hypothetical protein